MVADIARDPETAGLPLSGIGGITTWRDAAEYIALGCGTVQVCTAAMVYGFRIVHEMLAGLELWMDDKGYARLAEFRGRGGAQRHGLGAPEPQLCGEGEDRTGALHPVRAAATQRARILPTRPSPSWTGAGSR